MSRRVAIVLYGVCAVLVMMLGLASRRYREQLPPFLAEYAGDALWALLVFLLISVACSGMATTRRGGMALAFAYLIEFSQVYHADWIDALRRNWFGGLVLGHGFLWTDLVCYAVGVLAGVCSDRVVRPASQTGSRSFRTGGRNGSIRW